MTLPATPDVMTWIVTGILAMIVLSRAWPVIRRFVSTGDAIGGLPELITLVNALGSKVDVLGPKVDALTSQVEEIHHEVTLNDGSSVKDAVNRTESGVKRLEAVQSGQTVMLGATVERQNDIEKALVRVHERIDDVTPPTS